jgi:hypothetical protein
MTIEDLIINDVDTDLLEEQRHVLNFINDNPKLFPHLGPRRQKLIAGVTNMLNEWSDESYYREKPLD